MYWFLFFVFLFVKLSAHSGSAMEVLTLNWKKVLFTIAAIQVGTGVTIIGVLSFIPLFLVEMGVNDPGEAAFWSGADFRCHTDDGQLLCPGTGQERRNITGDAAFSALILALITLVTFGCALATRPWQLFILRMIQGLIGGFVPICAAMTVAVTPKEKMTYGLGVFQAANVMGITLGPVIGGVTADLFGYRMPFILFGSLAMVSVWALCFCCQISDLIRNRKALYGRICRISFPTLRCAS